MISVPMSLQTVGINTKRCLQILKRERRTLGKLRRYLSWISKRNAGFTDFKAHQWTKNDGTQILTHTDLSSFESFAQLSFRNNSLLNAIDAVNFWFVNVSNWNIDRIDDEPTVVLLSSRPNYMLKSFASMYAVWLVGKTIRIFSIHILQTTCVTCQYVRTLAIGSSFLLKPTAS